MSKYLLILPFLFCWLDAVTQARPKATRAVVIGISDYQHDEIPDLNYAHRDAAAFAAWLASNAGGRVASEHIRLLLNEQASIGRIVEALGWLVEESKEGDKAILFFSGHGDVETITKYKRGFLLAYNAPPRSYLTGGVLALRDIEDITNTLSDQGVEIMIITDACRSGKLAGSRVNGAQYTSVQLAQRFANEIKILSCQPEEYSSEGIQWGGGHGAFSYHLLDGLYGLADRNSDFQITLSELDRYLEDHVPKEVAPLAQTPISFGDRNTRLTFVDDELLAQRKNTQSRTLPMISTVAQKSQFNKRLEMADAAAMASYQLFDQALTQKAFFEPAETCADVLYDQLMANESLTLLHADIRRRYAATLQDDAQNALNSVLDLDANLLSTDWANLAKRYHQFPKYLQRSAELLGEQHYMYKSLKARSLFFEGLTQWLTYYLSATQEQANNVIRLYRASLEEEPYAPHTYHYMSTAFATTLSKPDSARYYADMATQQSPTWLLPYTTLAFHFTQKYQRFEEARTLLEKSKTVDADNDFVLQGFAFWHYFQNQLDSAAILYEASLEKDSTNALLWFNLGTIKMRTGHYDQAEAALLTSIEKDSTYHLSYYGLGFLYSALKRTKEAEAMLQASIRINPRFISGRKKLGVIYYQQEGYEAARDIWEEAHALKPHDVELCLNLAFVHIDLEDKDTALVYLEKALQRGNEKYDAILNDYEALNEMDGFHVLLKKYFPDQVKK